MMGAQKALTSRSRNADTSELERRIDRLIQKHPDLVDGRLISSREVIEESEELSKDIIESFRERLTP
jgi:hypothetical protein